MSTVAQKPEIQAQEIYKVTDRATGKECYAVPSDSQPGMFYMTCWNAESSMWECTCKHGQVSSACGLSAKCKHSRAAQVCVLANKERRARERIALEHHIDQDLLAHIADDLAGTPIDPHYQVVPGCCNGCGCTSKFAVCARCMWE